MRSNRRFFKKITSSLLSWALAICLVVAIIIYGPGVLIFHARIPRARASALSFICASSAASTSTASCSGEQAGDLLLIMCGETSGGSAPALPSGTTSISSLTNSAGSSGTRTGMQVGWTTAASSSSGSGTCGSGTTDTVMMVYRGQGSSPIGNTGTESGNNGATSVTYNAASQSVTDSSDWFAAFAIRNTGDSQMSTAPVGSVLSMTNRTSIPATPAAAGFDTNGPANTNWSAASVTGFSASSKYTELTVELLAAPVVTVGTSGSLVSSLTVGSTSDYVGGAFTFSRDVGTANVTSITVTENGTVNAASNLSNLILWYYQTSSCGTAIPGGATQFNSTSGTFSGTGPYTSTVTGTMTVLNGAPMCVYAQLDVGSGATPGQTIGIEIADPNTDVAVSVGTVQPSTAVAIPGTLTIAAVGPTTDQLLRGGEWFSGGAKQPFYWAQ